MPEYSVTRPASYSTVVVPANASVVLVSASPLRTALRLSVHGADVYISPSHSVVVGHGLRLVNGQHSEELCACHCGDYVSSVIYARADTNPATVYIIEGFEPYHPME